MYFYYFKSENTYIETPMLFTDLLGAINFAANHLKNYPKISEQKIIDEDMKEACVFRRIS